MEMNQLYPRHDIRVSFLNGEQNTAGVAEGNNAAWNCLCDTLMICRTSNFGKPCYVACRCGRKFCVEDHLGSSGGVVEFETGA